MKRRTLIKAGLTLPVGASILGCAPDKNLDSMTAGYEEGMYLAENYAPVMQEQTLTELKVTGTIPEELIGRFLRNGPNPSGDVDVAKHHWFTGKGMVHGVRLEDGHADWYRNRWVQGDSPNTNVIGHAERTFAIVESGGAPTELSYELDTIGAANWGGYTAHPKLDPDTGEMHAIAYDWASLRDHVKYLVIDSAANVRKSLDIPMQGMSMIHDMSLSQNYVVIYDLPVTISFKALAMGYGFPFRWDNEHEPRVGLMPRNGTPEEIIWSSIEPCYAYHPMNAYEDEAGNVVIDICRYDNMFLQDINGPFGDSLPRLDRWTINPTLAKLSEEVIDERNQEFPRCHPGLNSKPYQFGYALRAEGKSFPSILKHDLKTGESTSFEFGAGRHGAEPIFVPRDGAEAEDDGFLMTFVYDEKSAASELLIADARDLTRPALASIHVPRVPYGFHGNWLPD